jgi:hypothetical protein
MAQIILFEIGWIDIINGVITEITKSGELPSGACNLRRRAVVDALANGRFALKAAATVKQLYFWINQHGIVFRNPLGYRV